MEGEETNTTIQCAPASPQTDICLLIWKITVCYNYSATCFLFNLQHCFAFLAVYCAG